MYIVPIGKNLLEEGNILDKVCSKIETYKFMQRSRQPNGKVVDPCSEITGTGSDPRGKPTIKLNTINIYRFKNRFYY